MHVLRKSYITLIEVLIALGLTMLLLSTLTFFYSQMNDVNVRMDVVQEMTFKKLFLHTRFSTIFPRLIAETGKKNNKELRSDFQFFTSSTQNGSFKANTQSLVFSYNNGVNLDKKLSNYVLGRLYVDKKDRLVLATWPSPARWPSQGEVLPPMAKQVLLDQVENIAFEFYIAPERNRDFLKNSSNKDRESNPADQKQQDNTATVTPTATSPTSNVSQRQENVKKELPPPTPSGQHTTPQEMSKSASSQDNEGANEMEDKGEEPQPKGAWVKEWKKEYKQLPSMIRITMTVQKSGSGRDALVFSYPLVNSNKVIVYEN